MFSENVLSPNNLDDNHLGCHEVQHSFQRDGDQPWTKQQRASPSPEYVGITLLAAGDFWNLWNLWKA